MFKTILVSVMAIFCFFSSQAQEIPKNWYLLDSYTDGFNGISAKKAQELLVSRKSKSVVVAILDSGVDAEHEDLSENMWTNPNEIDGNGLDDDSNGYVDDIHGWNFIGGQMGNVGADSYEVTRLYAKLKYKYETAEPSKLTKAQKKEYQQFLDCKEQVDSRREAAQSNLDNINFSEKFIVEGIEMLATKLPEGIISLELLDKIDEGDSKSLSAGINIAKNVLEANSEIKSLKELKDLVNGEILEAKKQFSKELNFAFNPDLNERTRIVGDRIEDVMEKNYGNNNVEGPDATHGTHVAGVIAAIRNNGKGIDGITDKVKIMSVRCVPDGDERDKDVANAIRYAVDNGATVINMSFGKGFSPNKGAVDAAVKYASSKDVLLVHAAGNSGADNDKTGNFPNKKYEKKKIFSRNRAKNWLEVGASTPFESPNLIAGFSNYGKKNVDLFAPGVQIFSTTPDNTYSSLQGTSMASPIAAGVAALIRAYFPNLTAKQVKQVLMKSAVATQEKVNVPNTDQKKKMSEISVTGGLLNANNAVILASKTKGKKKVKDWPTSPNEVKSGLEPKA